MFELIGFQRMHIDSRSVGQLQLQPTFRKRIHFGHLIEAGQTQTNGKKRVIMTNSQHTHPSWPPSNLPAGGVRFDRNALIYKNKKNLRDRLQDEQLVEALFANAFDQTKPVVRDGKKLSVDRRKLMVVTSR